MKNQITLTLFVRDIAENIKFYCEYLRFSISYDWNKDGEERITRIANELGIQLSLQLPTTEWEQQLVGKQSGQFPYLNIDVTNINELYKELHQVGAPLDEALVSTPFGEFIYMTDPNGNKVTLSEYFIET